MGSRLSEAPDDVAERAMMQIEAEADVWLAETPQIGVAVRALAKGFPTHLRDRAAAQIDALVRQSFVEAFYRGFNAHKDHAAAPAILRRAVSAPSCGTAIRAGEEEIAAELCRRGLAWDRASTSPRGRRRLHITPAGRTALGQSEGGADGR